MTELVLQLTDLHLGARWDGTTPLDSLGRVVEAVRALPDRPAVAIVTGDLAHDGTPADYAAARAALAALDVPVHVLPGNHDDREALRAAFDIFGADEQPIAYPVEVGELRVLMLDTVRPGSAAGELGGERLGWLDAALTAAPARPTVIAMHHPPFVVGMAEMDRIGLPDGDRAAFAEIVARHPQVRGVVAGHTHRAIVASVAGRPALTIPSTSRQLPLDLQTVGLSMVAAPLGFALHGLVDGRLVSHVETL